MAIITIGNKYEDNIHQIASIGFVHDEDFKGDEITTFVVSEAPTPIIDPERPGVVKMPYFDKVKKEVVMIEEVIPKSQAQIMEEKVNLLEASVDIRPSIKLKDLVFVKESTVETLRLVKLNELKEICSDKIYSGFESKSTGYVFGLNNEDQMNFTQQLLLLVANKEAYAGGIDWKSKNQGVVKLSPEQFLSIVSEGELHKRATQVEYWELEKELNAATTKEEILKIEWI